MRLLAASGLSLMTALLIAALSSAGATGASAGEGGRIVHGTDPDASMIYEAAPGAAVCYVDTDGSATYQLGDSVVLAMQNGCSGTAGQTQVRLAVWGDQPAGKRIGTGQDRGLPLSSLSPQPVFHYDDLDDSKSLTPGDPVYLRMTNPTIGFVAVGDVRITAAGEHAPGTRVRSGDADHGQTTTPLGTAAERIRFVDVLDTNTFEAHDWIYLTADPSRSKAGPGDIRIYSPDDASPFGGPVRVGDSDAHAVFRAVARDACYVDDDGNGRHGIGETIYVTLAAGCSGEAQVGDVRISAGPSGAAGSRVSAGDADHGSAYLALPDARIGFIGDDGTLDPGDWVVLDLSGSSKVSAGDVLLTPTARGAGVPLSADDPLTGSPLNDLGLFRDLTVFLGASTRSALSADDVPYLSTRASVGDSLRPGDVRLVPVGGHPFGGPVGVETGEVPAKLSRGPAAICSPKVITSDYLPGDPVYLRIGGNCPASVGEGLVRLVAYEEHAAFSTVQEEDSDFGIGLSAASGVQYKFVNAFSPLGWNAREALYLDLISPSDNRVDVGDIRLTPLDKLPGGHVVLGADWDRGQRLTALGTVDALTAYFDEEGTGSFDPGDLAYVTPASNLGAVTPLSVRLSPLQEAFVAPSISPGTVAEPGSGDPAAPKTETSDPTQDPAPEQSLGDGAAENDESARTPGLAPAILLVSLAGLLYRRHRR